MKTFPGMTWNEFGMDERFKKNDNAFLQQKSFNFSAASRSVTDRLEGKYSQLFFHIEKRKSKN